LKLEDGLFIRTEDFASRRYIDGRLVASGDELDSTLLAKSEHSHPYKINWSPHSQSYDTYYRHLVISINGEFLVLDVRYSSRI